MIFVTLGSQKFQFNRLLKAIDKLIECGMITDDVFAQTGYSDYIPQHYDYKCFLNRDEFEDKMKLSSIVITHGGTGAIIGAIKKGKKVVAVPRLAKYGEHVDDHQLQLLKQFGELELISVCEDCEELGSLIQIVKDTSYRSYVSNTGVIIEDIESYIEGVKKK